MKSMKGRDCQEQNKNFCAKAPRRIKILHAEDAEVRGGRKREIMEVTGDKEIRFSRLRRISLHFPIPPYLHISYFLNLRVPPRPRRLGHFPMSWKRIVATPTKPFPVDGPGWRVLDWCRLAG